MRAVKSYKKVINKLLIESEIFPDNEYLIMYIS